MGIRSGQDKIVGMAKGKEAGDREGENRYNVVNLSPHMFIV